MEASYEIGSNDASPPCTCPKTARHPRQTVALEELHKNMHGSSRKDAHVLPFASCLNVSSEKEGFDSDF